MKKLFNNIFILIILFSGNIFLKEENHFFILIYLYLSLNHLYIYFQIKYHPNFDLKNFVITSLLLYLFTYLFIYDSNPFFYFISFYTFYPNFLKAIIIISIHSYFLYYYSNHNLGFFINLKTNEELHFKYKSKNNYKSDSLFFSFFFQNSLNAKNFKYFFIGLILFWIIEVIIFLNRTKIWIYFNKKEKALPNLTFKNSTLYITSNVANIESIIFNYIQQMKALINYLGERNIIISIVENGDSKDNTRKILKDFQSYLTEKNILNKFYLDRVIDDPRKNKKPFEKYSRLRIEYYAKLRNKCLEFLYQLPNIDFNNTIIIFLNDIVFKYEDIINLLSTNNEDFDVACGLDMNNNNSFHDRWVSIDLEGDGMRRYFPFFINKEAQDLVVNHKPIRVFSCLNGVIAFKAKPLENKKIQFRYKTNYSRLKHSLNNPAKDYYESECTYFNIDLFSMGYTKKFINPDVIVTYKHHRFFEYKYFVSSLKHIFGYFLLYFVGLTKKRNKYMSNYKSNKIQLSLILNNWYLENKK